MKNEKQGRRFLITMNCVSNVRVEEVSSKLKGLKHLKYYVFQKEDTHIHIFIVFKIAKRLRTIRKYFPTEYIECCKQYISNKVYRDYILKSGENCFVDEYGKYLPERTKKKKSYDRTIRNINKFSDKQLAIQELEKVKVNLIDKNKMMYDGEHSYLKKVVSWYDICDQINNQIKELKG